ncbi:MAG: SgcJ/EcaC family oxidoreductase [Methanoregula sp.]|nr:SgcJ/EcaC family oxidoreductase [Methanoregula sp.]
MGVTRSGYDNDRAAIRKLARDWNDGWNRGDTEALLALYTDDPVLMPQGMPAVTGKNAIRSLYQSLFRDFTIRGKGRIMEIEVSGNLGYFWNDYTLNATPKAGESRPGGRANRFLS